MGMIVVTGERGNILEGMVTVPTGSIADAANFPASRLTGRIPSNFWMAGSAWPDYALTFDANEVTNGGAESGAAITPWVDNSVGGGSNTFTSVTATPSPQSGSRAFKANVTSGGSNAGSGYIDIRVKAGQKKTLSVGMIADTASRTARLRIQCLQTGNYLTTGSAWQATATDCLTRAANTYATQTITFTMETLAIAKADTVTLRITCYCNQAGGTGYAGFDNVLLWSWPDMAMITGFLNLCPAISALEYRSSTDNFSGSDTLRATFTIPQLLAMSPAQYVTFTQHGDRYHRIRFVGTPPSALYGGQVAVCQKLTLNQPQEWGYSQEWAQAQVRSKVRAYRLEDAPTRAYALEFTEPSVTAYNEQRDAVIGASEMGYHPVILVPVDTEDVVIYGRIDPSVKMVRKFLNQWTTTYRVEELPHPTITNV